MADVELSVNLDSMRRFLPRILVVGFLLVVLSYELSVTLNSPIAFGDEGFHVSTARYIGTNVDYSATTPLYGSTLNPESYNRPPLWNLIEGSFYYMFGFSDTIVKVLMPFISFVTSLAIFVFVRKLYSETAGVIATIVAASIPSFVTYSVLFYSTVPYVLFFTLGFFSLLMAMKSGGRKFWLLAGVFSGVSIMTNVAGMVLPALTVVMGAYHLARNPSRRGLLDALKTYGMVLALAGLIMLPFVVRNVELYYVPGCHSISGIVQGNCPSAGTYQQVTSNDFAGRTAGGGTEGSILATGVVNYLQFAYGFVSSDGLMNTVGFAFLPFSVLAGMVIIAGRREAHDVAMVAAFIIFMLVFYQYGGLVSGRAEDTARYFLSAVPMVAAAAAVFWSSLRKAGRFAIPVLAAVIIVVAGLSFIDFYGKVAQMPAVKAFVPSFFQACDWIKQNTPADANLLSLQTYPTRYNCDRGAVWEIPDKADILLSNNLTLVRDRLAANGIGYVFVQKFALSTTPLGQAYPVSFVDFLEQNNQTFQNVYENGPAYGTQDFVNCANSGGCDPGNIVFKVD